MRVHLKATDKSGMCSLYIVTNRVWLRTGIKIVPEAWDVKAQRITAAMPEHKRLNSVLTKRKAEVHDILYRLKYEGLTVTKENIAALDRRSTKAVNTNPLVSALMLQYVEDNKAKLKHSYLRKYTTIANALDGWRAVKVLDFDAVALSDYVDHIISGDEGVQNNTVHDHVKKIRLVLKLAALRGLKVDLNAINYRVRYIKTAPVWLDSETELPLLEQFIPIERDQVYKDEFLFRCYTGLRFSDVHNLKPHHFIKRGQDVYLDITVVKTKMTHNILLSSKAAAIARRWDFKVPRLWCHHCNSRIKEICRGAKIKTVMEKVRFRGNERLVEVVPKFKLVTTHVARRTFGRLWLDRGGNIGKLSKYYGHSSEAQTAAYIGYEAAEINEELKRLMG